MQQLHPAVDFFQRRKARDHLAQAARIDVFDARHIQQNFSFAVLHQLTDKLAKLRAALAEPDVSFQIHNDYFAAAAFGDIKISHFYFPLILSGSRRKNEAAGSIFAALDNALKIRERLTEVII
jgi:hypothetical protein